MPLSVPEDLEGTFGGGGHPYTSSGPPSSLLPGPSVWADGEGLMDPPATDQGDIGTLSARSVWPQKQPKQTVRSAGKGHVALARGSTIIQALQHTQRDPPKRLPSTN